MNKNKARILGFIICLSAPGAILAEPPGPVIEISGDDIDDDERIVVTGSRLQRDEFTSTSPVQVIDDDIVRRDTVDLAELLSSVGGASAQTQIGGAAPGADTGVRGLDPGRTLVLVNGRRFVRAPGTTLITGVTVEGLPPIADSIERVEVLKGPASATLYGTDATAGAINITTKDEYEGFAVSGSWTLRETLRVSNNYTYAIQSTEQCDATNGAANPLWTYQDKHNFGMPDFDDRGHRLYFGSTDDGFRNGDFDDFSRFSFSRTPQLSLRSDPGYSYLLLGILTDAVMNDPSISESARSAFSFVAGMAMMFGGPEVFSDQAYVLGDFDPDGWYERLKQASSDESADSGPAANETPAVQPPVVETEAPAAGVEIAPFDRFPYPPDYSFDFSQCTVEQRDHALELIRQRDAARATMGYYMDYLRREGQSAEDAAEDVRRVDAATDLRDQKNQELKTYWQSCQAAGDAMTTRAADATSAGDAAATPAADDATQQSATESRGSCNFNDSNKFNWNLEFHVSERYRQPDGSPGSRPAQGLGIDVFPRNRPFGRSLPFSGLRVDLDYDLGDVNPKRTFTDSDGRACVPLDEVSPQAYLTPEMLRTILGPDYQAGAGAQPPSTSQGATPSLTDSTLGLGLGYRYRFEPRTRGGLDWKIAVDLGMRGNYRPTLGVKLYWDKVDSVIQEYPGLGGAGMNFFNLPPETRDAIPDDFKFRVDAGFTIGDSFYLPFTFAEKENLDLGLLNNVPGQSGWTNNFCGDAALPPQGAGYLTKEMSPVKSLEDRWALERANVPDNDSLYIQYADPVIIGIIDTGLDWQHPDISWDNLWQNEDEIPDNGIDDDNNGYVDDVIGWNFMGDNNKPWDNDGHGTFVAGLIAATRGNDIGIDGINPNAKIMVLKALNNFGRTRASYIAQAIVYGADNGARILNLSVTGPGFPKVVQDAVDYAESKGVLVVVAAGNRAEDIDRVRPSVLQGVMTVAATGPDDKRTVFSNVGAAIDITAPGQDVVSLRARQTDFMYNSAETTYVPGDAYLGDDNAYYRATGTSFAAPIVSGAASLVMSSQPNLNYIQVRRMLEQSARDIETPGRDRFTGYGLVDAEAALGSNPEFYIYAEIPAVRRVDIDGQTFLQVIGVADANQFAKASLEIGQGDDPQSWTNTGSDLTTPVQLGELGRISADRFGGAPTWTIRVVVQHQGGQQREARYVIELE